MNLLEHHSSFSPNMLMQFFFYTPKLCEKFIANTELLPLQQHDNGALQPVSPDVEFSTPVNIPLIVKASRFSEDAIR
ncbi:MAG: hypothetical protein IJ597_05025, partial [Synergistaceae bacterium]|nr:hypothetical protein [Synergistaceae bacterium]